MTFAAHADPKNEAPLNAQGFDAHDELPEHSIFFEGTESSVVANNFIYTGEVMAEYSFVNFNAPVGGGFGGRGGMCVVFFRDALACCVRMWSLL